MKLSIHFGLNGVNPDAYNGWEGDLSACDADAAAMAATFGRWGYTAQGFMDADATLAMFRENIQGAAARMIAGDWFVLSFSGHGGQVPAWTLAGHKETICLYDGQLYDTELHNLLTAFAPGVNVVVILDSCHSGGMDRVPRIDRVRYAPLFVTQRTLPPPVQRSGEIVNNAALFTACRVDETASDGGPNQINGAFTNSLLATAGDGSETFDAWAAATKAFMLRNVPAQHPQWITVNGTIPTIPIGS